MSAKSLSPESIRQASTWMARLWADDVTDEDREALQQWRKAHPDNNRAWQQLQQLQTRFRELPNPRASQHALIRGGKGSRRRLLVWFGISIGAAGLFGLRNGPGSSHTVAGHRTDVGEIRQLLLANGSQLVLNTDTRIEIDDQARRLRLLDGEIMMTSAPDSEPFRIVSREGRVRPIGTRFSVRQWNGRTQVEVFEGRVSITPSRAAAAREIEAGSGAFFDSGQVHTPYRNRFSDQAWTEQRLVATSMPLTEFVQELSRYRRGVLRVDPALGHLRVTGVFSLQDTDTTLQHLSEILPIEVRYFTPYWVSIDAR